MVNLIDIEKSIICTLLTTYTMQDGSYLSIMEFEVKDEYFSAHFYKTVVRAINWLKNNNKSISDEIVIHYLFKYNKMDEKLMLDILSHNCLGVDLFETYLEILKSESKLNSVRDI